MPINTFTIYDRFKRYIPYLIIGVLIFFLYQSCENEKTALANYDASQSKMTSYKLKNGQLVNSVQTLELDKSQLKKQILSGNKKLAEITKKFSNVKSVTVVHESVRIDSIDVPYAVEVPCKFSRNDSVMEKKKQYSFKYFSNEKGLKIYDLEIKDTLNIVTGTKRKWLFGKSTAFMDISHSNSYIQQNDKPQHIEVKQKKTIFGDIVKVALGFGLAKLILN